MKKEDIIRMADKARFEIVRGDGWPDEQLIHKLERFAALVAFAEHEACANSMVKIVMIPTLTHGALVKLSDVVNAIRARGQKPAAYESSIGYMFGDKR